MQSNTELSLIMRKIIASLSNLEKNNQRCDVSIKMLERWTTKVEKMEKIIEIINYVSEEQIVNISEQMLNAKELQGE